MNKFIFCFYFPLICMYLCVHKQRRTRNTCPMVKRFFCEKINKIQKKGANLRDKKKRAAALLIEPVQIIVLCNETRALWLWWNVQRILELAVKVAPPLYVGLKRKTRATKSLQRRLWIVMLSGTECNDGKRGVSLHCQILKAINYITTNDGTVHAECKC